MKRNFINTVIRNQRPGSVVGAAGPGKCRGLLRKTKGYRVEPESDPPRYVRNLSKTQFEQFRDIDWLNVGLDHRTRYEYRENDYRFWTKTDPTLGPQQEDTVPTRTICFC